MREVIDGNQDNANDGSDECNNLEHVNDIDVMMMGAIVMVLIIRQDTESGIPGF